MIEPTEQPKNSKHSPTCAFLNHPYADCTCKEIEQPNQELMIIKIIQDLMTVVNNNLSKLDEETQMLSCHRNVLVRRALEEIDLFERTTLFDLQKAFE